MKFSRYKGIQSNRVEIEIENGDLVLTMGSDGGEKLYLQIQNRMILTDYEEFVIPPGTFIYTVFNNFYEDTISANVTGFNNLDTTNMAENLKKTVESLRRQSETFKRTQTYQDLVRGENVIWHSEDARACGTLTVCRESEHIVLKILRDKDAEQSTDRITIIINSSTRFKDKASRYGPFSQIMWNLY